MGGRLRMTTELSDWLAELSQSHPAATEVAAALVAVLESADPTALTIVSMPRPAAEPVIADPREAADVAYQQLLEELQVVRRRVAGAASARSAAERRLADRREAGAAAEIAELEHDLAAAQQREARFAELSGRIQRDVDAFRSAKEAGKAMYTAAEAQLRIAEAIAAPEGPSSDAELAGLNASVETADEMLERVTAQGMDTLRRIRQQAGQTDDEHPEPRAGPPREPPPPPPGTARPAPGLLELRADSLGTDIRILFAVEPKGTVTLLAVLEGSDAVSEHEAQALRLASDLLTEIRDDGWPADIEEVALADSGAFLARFFPADDGSIARRASALVGMRPLSKLRDDLHLTVADIAVRSGLSTQRVAAIEREGLRTARVHEAVALARALGARLDLPSGSGAVVS